MKQLANLVLSLAVSGSVILGMESGVDFSARRRELLARVHEVHMDDSGPILLLADYESGITRFRQESSFYYLTDKNCFYFLRFLYFDNYTIRTARLEFYFF